MFLTRFLNSRKKKSYIKIFIAALFEKLGAFPFFPFFPPFWVLQPLQFTKITFLWEKR